MGLHMRLARVSQGETRSQCRYVYPDAPKGWGETMAKTATNIDPITASMIARAKDAGFDPALLAMVETGDAEIIESDGELYVFPTSDAEIIEANDQQQIARAKSKLIALAKSARETVNAGESYHFDLPGSYDSDPKSKHKADSNRRYSVRIDFDDGTSESVSVPNAIGNLKDLGDSVSWQKRSRPAKDAKGRSIVLFVGIRIAGVKSQDGTGDAQGDAGDTETGDDSQGDSQGD